METIIKVNGLSKIYRIYDNPKDRLKESLSRKNKRYSKDFFALKDVSFDIKKGENVGLIGTNGAGKSTLLKIITGVLKPSEGEVEVDGKISALLELGTGFNPEYSGLQNIFLNGSMMGFSHEEMESKVEDILAFADIGDYINQPVKTYSSGMFARLAFAVAINVEPEILIVDEALSVGDMRFQMKCMNKMKAMMEGGTTVLFVSHDINAIKRFCSRAIWINHGTVQEDGDVNKVTDDYLDFLKYGEIITDKNLDENNLPEFKPNNSIAEIISFRMLNQDGKEVNQVNLDEPILIDVTYDVYDENVDKPVLGIALYGMDDDYLCGLNTLLDNVQIPWTYGRNKIYLEYAEGMRVTGGKYMFLVSLMDETASVCIHSISGVKEFSIKTGYVGEGRFILPHEWKTKFEEGK